MKTMSGKSKSIMSGIKVVCFDRNIQSYRIKQTLKDFNMLIKNIIKTCFCVLFVNLIVLISCANELPTDSATISSTSSPNKAYNILHNKDTETSDTIIVETDTTKQVEPNNNTIQTNDECFESADENIEVNISTTVIRKTKLPSDGDLGNYGRLYIPDVGWSMRLNWTDYIEMQDVVDKWDMGAITADWINEMGALLIGDHNHQGFNAMINSVPNKTIAYILRTNGVYEQYICRTIFYGHNTLDALTDSEYHDIWCPYDIIMYTCAGDGTYSNVYISYWEKVN